VAGASASAASGVVVGAWGYATLTVFAALATAPLIVLASSSRKRAGDRHGLPPTSDRQQSVVNFGDR